MKKLLGILIVGSVVCCISNCNKDKIVEPNTNITYTILWSRQQSPITISDTFIVDEYDTLLIEPGVTVQFDTSIPLVVEGTLLSLGAPSDSIILTSLNTNNYWGGIHFLNTEFTSILKYTTVIHCWQQVLLMENSSPNISNCRLEDSFTDSETGGFLITCMGVSFPYIANCYMSGFTNYKAYGVYCTTPANPRLIHNNIIGYRDALDICVNGGGFLSGNYLAVYVLRNNEYFLVPDISLGYPVDQIGDGVCTTNSTDSLSLFLEVDGVSQPRSIPN
jgi:hypothetical protein